MKNILIVAFAVLSASLVTATSLDGRIIGGETAEPHQFPFICALRRNGAFGCGATIINENWILTAAHCIDGIEIIPEQFSFACGKHDLRIVEDGEQIVYAEQIFPHELFGELPQTFPYDIALVKLQTPLVYSETVLPVALAPTLYDHMERDATILGWGVWRIEPELEVSPVLQYADIPLLTYEQCEAVTAEYEIPLQNTICTGPLEGGFGGCNGDSGGPMIQEVDIEIGTEYLQVGVAAWAIRPCGAPNAPTGYVSVSALRSWIDEIISNN